MTESLRKERLLTELEAMQALQNVSTIIQFEAKEDPPERYLVTLHGRGFCRGAMRTKVEVAEEHKIEIRLAFSFPKRPPDIRWKTPIFHPNISFGGFVDLDDIGLPWREELGLDVVCERLWDVCRMAYVEMEGASNRSAAKWVQRQSEFGLPIDVRPLRDSKTPAAKNVVRYRRRGAQEEDVQQLEPADILYIGEDTPTPSLPRRGGSDDDVFYIGDE